VAISGDRLVIGVPDDPTPGGAGYVYRQEGSNWVIEAKISRTDIAPAGRLGSAAAIDGDLLVLGAPADDLWGAYSGSAYVFRRSGQTWIQEAKLVAMDAAAFAEFGNAVTVSGDCVIVGAYGARAAYAFRDAGGTWVQESKLTVPEPPLRFGVSVSLDNDRVAVGADGGSTSSRSSASRGPTRRASCRRTTTSTTCSAGRSR
jgi:hypothetical protein